MTRGVERSQPESLDAFIIRCRQYESSLASLATTIMQHFFLSTLCSHITVSTTLRSDVCKRIDPIIAELPC